MKKVNILSIYSLIFILALSGCQNFSWLPKEKPTETTKKTVKTDGVHKSYKKNGTLYSEISYKNGERDGLAVVYYPDGKIKQSIDFKNGEKDGLAKIYYESGILNRETSYKEGIKNGPQKKYFQDETLASSITYKDDLPGTDLKEYLKSGKEKSNYPSLIVKQIDRLKESGKYIIEVTFSKNPRRADYYFGELIDGKFFQPYSLEKLPEKNGVAYYTIKPPPGIFIMRKINVVGKLKTSRRNLLIKQKTVNLAIEVAI